MHDLHEDVIHRPQIRRHQPSTALPGAPFQQGPSANPQVTALPLRSKPECGRSQVTGELPASKRGLLVVLAEYRHALYTLAFAAERPPSEPGPGRLRGARIPAVEASGSRLGQACRNFEAATGRRGSPLTAT